MGNQNRDIVITGVGLLTAAGGTNATFGTWLRNQTVLTKPLGSRWPSGVVDTAWLSWPRPMRDVRKYAGRTSQLAVTATAEALESAGLQGQAPQAARCGVVAVAEFDFAQASQLADVIAGEDPRPLALRIYDELADFYILRTLPALCAQFVSLQSGFKTQAVAVTMPAQAGLSGLALAMRLLESDELDAVVVSAATPLPGAEIHVAHDRIEPLGTNAATGHGPYGAERAGTFMGEGAATLVLETRELAERRGARKRGRMLACETATGRTSLESLELVLSAALAHQDEPRVIFAHGAGTQHGDAMEARCLASRARVPVTASKGCFGNLLGVSGMVDLGLAVKVLEEKQLPPVTLLGTGDESLEPLDFVKSPRAFASGGPALVVAIDGHHGPGAGGVLVEATG